MLTQRDQHLITVAQELIAQRFREGYHHIAAALRMTSDQIFTGVHVEAYIGRMTVMALLPDKYTREDEDGACDG